MRGRSLLLLATASALVAQTPQDAWFGESQAFVISQALGQSWVRPGLNLRGRTLRVEAWEPTAWSSGRRATKDDLLLLRLEGDLRPDLVAGLRKALKGVALVSLTEGDVRVVARVVDVIGERADAGFSDPSIITVQVKLMDAVSGELLAAFQNVLRGANPDVLGLRYQDWCLDLGRALASAPPEPKAISAPKPVVAPAPPLAPKPSALMAKPAAAPPGFDLEGALRRIEGLERDGVLSPLEAEALRRRAQEKARP